MGYLYLVSKSHRCHYSIGIGLDFVSDLMIVNLSFVLFR